jgi:SPP1 gp7 family putative phage head morphogenesis protein
MALTGGDLARKRLSIREQRDFAYFLAEFLKIRNRLSKEIDETLTALQAAKDAGEPVDPATLAKNARLNRLLKQIDAEIRRISPEFADRIADAKTDAVRIAKRQAAELPNLTADLELFDLEATEEFLYTAGDGRPLAEYFKDLAKPVRTAVFDSVAYGIAAGLPNAAIAKDINDQVGKGAVRAMTVARTETNRAYRNASREFYQAEPSVLGWKWVSARDLNTCPICWKHHGQIFSPVQTMQTHPNCRCVMVPILDMSEPVDLGSERFKKLTDAQQKAILGPKRFELYKQGATLADFVGVKDSPFGPTPVLKTLDQVRFIRKDVAIDPPKPTIVTPPPAMPAVNAGRGDAATAPFDAKAFRERFVRDASAIRGDLVDRREELRKAKFDALNAFYLAGEGDEFKIAQDRKDAAKKAYSDHVAEMVDTIAKERRLVMHEGEPAELPFKVERGKAETIQAAGAAVKMFGRLVRRDAWPDPPTITFQHSTNRAKYQNADKRVVGTLSVDRKAQQTLLHELGHSLEYGNAAAKKAIVDFLNRRTKGEKPEKLKKLTGINYDRTEIARPDKFIDPYVGKVYGDDPENPRSTEVLSMGLEWMFEDPLKFAKADPEHFELIIWIMRGAK